MCRSGVPREELFITTKVWPANYRSMEPSIHESLRNLQTDYIDLVLLHWPGCEGDGDGRLQAWTALEKVYDAGFARAIGISNFLPRHLEPVFDHATVSLCRPASAPYHRVDDCIVCASLSNGTLLLPTDKTIGQPVRV